MIPFGEFHEWGRFWDRAMTNGEYAVDFTPRTNPPDPKSDPSFEEQLNAIHHLDDTVPYGTQLDLLLPIKPNADAAAGSSGLRKRKTPEVHRMIETIQETQTEYGKARVGTDQYRFPPSFYAESIRQTGMESIAVLKLS